MTLRDYADEPFETTEPAEPADWRGPAAKRPPAKVVIDDGEENEEDPHHV